LCRFQHGGRLVSRDHDHSIVVGNNHVAGADGSTRSHTGTFTDLADSLIRSSYTEIACQSAGTFSYLSRSHPGTEEIEWYSWNSSTPSYPRLRPNPLCLKPPNGPLLS